MANRYYARSATFAASTTARGSEVRGEYDLVVNGFTAAQQDIDSLSADIGNLQTGDPPGWGAAIDSRWFVFDSSSSTTAYTGTLTPAPTGEALSDGYTVEFLPNNNNTGAATLNVGSTDGAIPIVKVSGPAYIATEANDLTTLNPVRLTFLAGNWVIRKEKPAGEDTGVVKAFAGSSAPTGYVLCYGQEISRITYADLFVVIGTSYGAGDNVNTFNVPDLRGRTLAGLDNMGGTSANRVTVAAADTIGGTTGTETHTLTQAELPAHTHTLTSDGGGAFTSASNGGHTHTTDPDGSHAHTMQGAGGHSHTGTAVAVGNHTHTMTVGGNSSQTDGSGGATVSGMNDTTTGAAGGHSHSLSIASASDHTHTIYTNGSHSHTMDTQGAHTHSTTLPNHTHTVGSVGSGTAHNNLQPTLFMNFIIKV